MINLEEYLAEEKAKWEIVRSNDELAKAHGLLVGRYLREPYADGYAYYEIYREYKKTVGIRSIDIGDGWVIPYWGTKATIEKSYAVEELRRRDALEKMFSKK